MSDFVRAMIVQQSNSLGLQLTFAEPIGQLIAPFARPEGTLRKGLIISKTHEGDAGGRSVRRTVASTGASTYRMSLGGGWAGASLATPTIETQVGCVVSKEAGTVRILLDEIDMSMLPSRTPKNYRSEASPPAPLPRLFPPPIQLPVDDFDAVRAALTYINTAGNRPLWNAVVTLHSLANRLHVRLRLTDEGVKATREVDL